MTSIAINKRTFPLFFDIIAIAFIYLVPTISHALAFPLYYFEPMRLMVILALVHTNRRNAFILAATLPLVSFMFSGHPVLLKMFLITGELVLNVALFYVFINFIKKTFPAVMLSIVLSKAVYYLAKFLLIQWALLDSSLISTALWVQASTLIAFSLYVYFFFKENMGKTE